MKRLALPDVDYVYSCSERARFQRRSVAFAEFKRFSFALRSFERSLGEASDDEYWRDFVRPLRSYGFRLLAAPLPSGHPAALSGAGPEVWRERVAKCEYVYPDLAVPARAVADLAEALVQTNSSPLLDTIWELVCEAKDRGESAAVTVKDRRLASATGAVFEGDPDLREAAVLVPAQLRDERCYDMLLAVGSDSWFPEHVFGAPRAHNVCLVHYGWISASFSLKPRLLGSSTARKVPASVEVSERCAPDEIMSAEELEPVFDWNAALAQMRRTAASGPASELVGARLILLEGRWAAFLEADEGATIQAIDLEEEQSLRLKRAPVRDVEPGMYVILRTGGGGDYIVPLADRILAEKAERLRELQRDWKKRLREAVNLWGLAAAAAQLRRLGSRLANEQNLRNWMSPRTIRPHFYEDFQADMQLIGLGGRAKEYWEAMETISRAHRKAGFRIRKLLLEEVMRTDSQDLEGRGRKDFNLDEATGSVLTAFRVEEISDEVVMVSPGRIGEPFELEGDLLWRG